MEAFSALLALCAGNSPVTGEFLAQRPVTRSFDVFFSLISAWTNGWVNNRRRWFETPSRSLRRHCNAVTLNASKLMFLHWKLSSCTWIWCLYMQVYTYQIWLYIIYHCMDAIEHVVIRQFLYKSSPCVGAFDSTYIVVCFKLYFDLSIR